MSARSLLAVAALLAGSPAAADPAGPNQPAAPTADAQPVPRKPERTRPGPRAPGSAQRERQLEAPGAALMLIPASLDRELPMGFLPL